MKRFFVILAALFVALCIAGPGFTASRPIAFIPTGTGVVHVIGGAEQSAASTVDLTADVSGTLPVANGGTGAASWSTGLLHANGTSITSSAVALGGADVSGTLGHGNGGTDVTSPGVSGKVLRSNGTSWTSGTVDVSSDITGTLAIGNGGTGQTSFATGVITSTGSALTSTAAGNAGNVLTSNGTSWVSQSPWVSAFDCNFVTQSTQTLSTNTTFTICGVTWTKANSANDATAMVVTNGTGLVIRPATSAYGATRTAPLIQVPLSSLISATDFSSASALRVWIWLSTTSASSIGAGNKLWVAVDTGNTNFAMLMSCNFASSVTACTSGAGGVLSATLTETTDGGGGNAFDYSTKKSMMMLVPMIGGLGASLPVVTFGGASASGGWPAITAMTPNLSVAGVSLSGIGVRQFPANVGTLNLVIAGASGGAPNLPIFTVGRVRVDYRL